MDQNLAVGFMSFLKEEDTNMKKPRRESSACKEFYQDSLQSETNTFEPLLVYQGPIYMKRTTWSKYWGECTLGGVLIIKRKEEDVKIYRQYKLKFCSIIKRRDKNFQLLRQGKSTIQFRTTTSDECNIWIPTLSQYSAEMYTKLLLNIKMPMLVWNTRGIIISLNTAASDFLAYRCEQNLIGKNISSILPPEECTTNEVISGVTRNDCELNCSAMSDTAIVIPAKGDAKYVLYCLGSYREYEKERFMFAFLPTCAITKPVVEARRFLDPYLMRRDIDDLSWVIFS